MNKSSIMVYKDGVFVGECKYIVYNGERSAMLLEHMGKKFCLTDGRISTIDEVLSDDCTVIQRITTSDATTVSTLFPSVKIYIPG